MYVLETNVGDYIVSKKKSAVAWLKELRQTNPNMKGLWVYTSGGWWISCATVNENGEVVKDFYCPDGAIREWVIWACSVFADGDYNEFGYEECYRKAHRIKNIADKRDYWSSPEDFKKEYAAVYRKRL